MRLSYFPKSGARNSAPVIAALMQGFQLHGVCPDLESYNSDMVMLWSQLWAGRMLPNQAIYQHYRSKGRPVVFIDVGTLQRNQTWKIMLNGDARLAGHGHDSARRDKLGVKIKSWQRKGNYIVVALQRPDSNQWRGLPDLESWTTATVLEIQRHSQRPIMIRPHPRYSFMQNLTNVSINTPLRVPGTYDDYDFAQCLDNAWAVVNWNSSPGVLSVLNGVPAFVGPDSLAAPMSYSDLTSIENPTIPDREQWCNDLAWTEWTVEEMALGVPQGFLLDRLQISDLRNS